MNRVPFPYRSLLLAAAAMVVAARPSWFDWMCYRKGAIQAGQIWRILTGHLVHASRDHLLWDALALLLIGFLFEKHLGRHFAWVTVFSMFVVSGGLLALHPSLEAYCGLSGVLTAQWVCGAMLAAHEERVSGRVVLSGLYWGCVFLDGGKLIYEASVGHSLFVDIHRLGGHPVPVAHLCGALAGILACMVVLSRQSSNELACRGLQTR
ncbi:MAG: rhombosortase [Acidobacteria bacterium]|nr:rhombosortase [Acidobacteriota bacterium]